MIRLHHRREVAASADAMWAVTGDLRRIGACFPGAEVDTVTDSGYTGRLTVGVGPITLRFDGTGEVRERDAARRRMVFHSVGTEARGLGGATMTMTATVTEGSTPERAVVDVVTELSLHKLPTPIGSGLAQAVSDPLIEAFLDCLADPGCAAPPCDPKGRLDALGAVGSGVLGYAGRLLRRR